MISTAKRQRVVRVTSLDEFFVAEACFPHGQIEPAPAVLEQLNHLASSDLEYKREEAKHLVALFRKEVERS